MASSMERFRVRISAITDTSITMVPVAGESSLLDLGREITQIVFTTTDIVGGPNGPYLATDRQFDIKMDKK